MWIFRWFTILWGKRGKIREKTQCLSCVSTANKASSPLGALLKRPSAGGRAVESDYTSTQYYGDGEMLQHRPDSWEREIRTHNVCVCLCLIIFDIGMSVRHIHCKTHTHVSLYNYFNLACVCETHRHHTHLGQCVDLIFALSLCCPLKVN